MLKEIDARGKAVLIISDTHIPYEHFQYLDFVKAVNKKYKCKIQIHVGDEVDNHAISFHDSDAELYSAGHELQIAINMLEMWNKAFPKLILLDSNHGSLAFRRFKAAGIPITIMKPLKEIYNTPKWTWYEDVLIETHKGKVYGCHGKSGVHNKLSREMGCSAFQGHYHGKFEITWSRSILDERWNMFVGCGINRDSLAFAYGKNHLPKPILGCGVIDEKGIPHLVKMHLDENGHWTGKL